jgi:serine/threonine-protein phosphatase 2A regulatory subunit B
MIAIVDLKPQDLAEITELITSASFHPLNCHTLMHGSSKGVIRLADMRKKALVDRDALVLEVKSTEPRTYFSEITNSILDAKFSADGRYILSRDYMTVRLWDTHMAHRPVAVESLGVHPYLSAHFTPLLENEAIFDQFHCALSPDGKRFVTGSYNNSFYVHNMDAHSSLTISARYYYISLVHCVTND